MVNVTVGCRVIVASAPGKMRDLYYHVRSLREQLFQKDEGLLGSVWPMMIYVRVHVHHNRHMMLIGGTEYPSHAREMIRIVNIHIRVPEVQLQSGAQVWIFRATCDLFECIWSEWVDAAKPEQSLRVFRYLRTSPVVFSHDVLVFIRNRRLVWIREAICNRQYDGSPDSGSIELCNQVIGVDALRSGRRSCACFGAV